MTSELRLHLERVLDAPPERVFEACVDPELLAKWWGPRDFTSPSLELDVRPGGRYRIAMQPPDGELFHLRGEYREVDPPERLVFTFEWEDPDPDDITNVVTLTFREVDDGTRVVLDQGPFATEARHALHDGGWTDSFVRLAAVFEESPRAA